jgi:mono/diheme cytochrome c family protein
MTLYMLFAGFSAVIYTGATYAVTAAGVGSAHASFALLFAVIGSLSIVLAAVVSFYTNRFVHAHALIAAFVFGSAVTIAIAATSESTEQGVFPATNSPAVVVTSESARVLAGEKLFQQLGCIGCHRPDGKGIGPALAGRFGRPVPNPGCGALTMDDEYVRESILNPSATVAAGFAPVMPTFAGRVTEEQLRALIVYLKSLKEETP